VNTKQTIQNNIKSVHRINREKGKVKENVKGVQSNRVKRVHRVKRKKRQRKERSGEQTE